MAHVRKGLLTIPYERWKHLDYRKRRYWKTERGAARRMIRRVLEREMN